MYMSLLIATKFLSNRAVYDGDDIDHFMEKLDACIKNHDHEIERMCNYHYQGFIDSIRELQQVSGDATKLKVRSVLALCCCHNCTIDYGW